MTRNLRVPSPCNGGAEEDCIEDKGNIENDIGSYCTVYEPFDFGIVIDGKDSAEEEEEGRFDAERDRKIQDFDYVTKLHKNVGSGTTDGQSDQMKAHLEQWKEPNCWNVPEMTAKAILDGWYLTSVSEIILEIANQRTMMRLPDRMRPENDTSST